MCGIKTVSCPECGGKDTVQLVRMPGMERDEFLCSECCHLFNYEQVIGIIYAAGAMERMNAEDLAQEHAHFVTEELLPQEMQKESMDNLLHEIHMKSLLSGKEAACRTN